MQRQNFEANLCKTNMVVRGGIVKNGLSNSRVYLCWFCGLRVMADSVVSAQHGNASNVYTIYTQPTCLSACYKPLSQTCLSACCLRCVYQSVASDLSISMLPQKCLSACFYLLPQTCLSACYQPFHQMCLSACCLRRVYQPVTSHCLRRVYQPVASDLSISLLPQTCLSACCLRPVYQSVTSHCLKPVYQPYASEVYISLLP